MGLGEQVMEPGNGGGGARRPKEGVGAVVTAVCRQGGDDCYSCVVTALPAPACASDFIYSPPALEVTFVGMCDQKAKEGSPVSHVHLLALLAEITTSPRTPWYLQGVCIIKH